MHSWKIRNANLIVGLFAMAVIVALIATSLYVRIIQNRDTFVLLASMDEEDVGEIRAKTAVFYNGLEVGEVVAQLRAADRVEELPPDSDESRTLNEAIEVGELGQLVILKIELRKGQKGDEWEKALIDLDAQTVDGRKKLKPQFSMNVRHGYGGVGQVYIEIVPKPQQPEWIGKIVDLRAAEIVAENETLVASDAKVKAAREFLASGIIDQSQYQVWQDDFRAGMLGGVETRYGVKITSERARIDALYEHIEPEQQVQEVISNSVKSAVATLATFSSEFEGVGDESKVTLKKHADATTIVTAEVGRIASQFEQFRDHWNSELTKFRSDFDARSTEALSKYASTTENLDKTLQRLRDSASEFDKSTQDITGMFEATSKSLATLLENSNVVAERLKTESNDLPGTIAETRQAVESTNNAVNEAKSAFEAAKRAFEDARTFLNTSSGAVEETRQTARQTRQLVDGVQNSPVIKSLTDTPSQSRTYLP